MSEAVPRLHRPRVQRGLDNDREKTTEPLLRHVTHGGVNHVVRSWRGARLWERLVRCCRDLVPELAGFARPVPGDAASMTITTVATQQAPSA